jgi:hypothetical protein
MTVILQDQLIDLKMAKTCTVYLQYILQYIFEICFGLEEEELT